MNEIHGTCCKSTYEIDKGDLWNKCGDKGTIVTVGELLSSGGSGKLNSDFSSRQSSERSSECLFREKYQDRS